MSALLPTPNADLAETVELGLLQDDLQQAATQTILAIQGLDVTPPPDLAARLAYFRALLDAAGRADQASRASMRLAVHLYERASHVLGAID